MVERFDYIVWCLHVFRSYHILKINRIFNVRRRSSLRMDIFTFFRYFVVATSFYDEVLLSEMSYEDPFILLFVVSFDVIEMRNALRILRCAKNI